jgi:hypothetical protein
LAFYPFFAQNATKNKTPLVRGFRLQEWLLGISNQAGQKPFRAKKTEFD